MIRTFPLFLLLAACTADAEFGSSLYKGPDRTQLFVSPHGEPFRPTTAGVQPMRAWFAGADANRDGELDIAEFRADGDRWFARLSGADAEIDGFEVSAYEREALPEMTPAPPRRASADETIADPDIIRLPSSDPGRRGARGVNLEGAAPFGLTGEPHPVMAADFDQSRRIDAGEFRRASDERFRLLDKAKDGRLNWNELATMKPARRRRPAPPPGQMQIRPRLSTS
jgi:hypothetical protein